MTRSDLPSGTVTFLFTDIEGSTRLWERDPATMWRIVHRHNTILGTAIADHGGHHFKTVGDAYQAAFPDVPSAVAAAVAAQRALAAEPWPGTGPIRVRMALHLGEAAPLNGDYLAPCLNRLARLLSTGYGGQVLLTDATRRLAEGHLPAGAALRGLGRHRLRDLLDPEEVWQLDITGLPATFPPLKSLETHPTNLPAQPNALVGREADLAALLPLVTDPATRLLTLTGPGGTGKTRLSLQLAADAIDAFPDGAFFVGLAALTDPALLLPEIAGVLGVHEGGGLSLRDALVGYLAPKRLLLVLDNLEQFRPPEDAARTVADLLAAAPGLTVLATSRAPLRVRAEREAPVLPLPVPDPGLLATPETLAANPSVQLFVQRAQAARPAFALDAGNAAPVAEIVRRLDGLPLAIELAAARTRALAPADLAARLGGRLDLLAARTADLPDRQQTLRATIDWSHDLLAPGEQALFRRLSVFAGGSTLAAAEAVANVPAPLPADPLDALTVLIEQSLLRMEEGNDEPRYRMLETIRAYGRERLAAAGEEAALLAAHAAWCLDHSTEGEQHYFRGDSAAWLDRFEAEHDNFRAALACDLEQGRLRDAMLLAGNLWPFWEARGHLAEGRVWFDRLLAADSGEPTKQRQIVLEGAGNLASAQGDLAAAQTLMERAVEVARKVGDQRGLATSLSNLGNILDRQGNYAAAADHHEHSLDLYRALGLRREEAVALNNLGLIAQNQGDLDRAVALYEESLTIKRDLGNKAGAAVSLTNLAVIAFERGETAAAIRRLEEALAIDRELGNRIGIADGLDNIGGVVAAEGDLPRAAGMLAEALAVRRDLGDRFSVAYSLENVAYLVHRAGDPVATARFYGAADALRQQIGAPRPPLEQARVDDSLAALRQEIGGAATEDALAAGRALDWEAAVAEALAAADRVAAGAGASAAPGEVGEDRPDLPHGVGELLPAAGSDGAVGHG